MKPHVLLCIAAAASIAAAAPTLAHPGGGGGMTRGSGGMGTEMSVGGHGLSSESHMNGGLSSRSHVNRGLSSRSHMNGTVHGSNAAVHSHSSLSANARAANVLGNLNAAHASSMALAHASSHSTVGAIATYKTSMTNALALTNTTDQTNAIIAARQQLAMRSNKQLTPTAITRVDSLIGVSGADPTLGTTP